MNYLGHWLFSEPTHDALVGSLWPDFGKRPAPEQVSEALLRHFDRHQQLDRYTDSSPTLEPVRVALRPALRKTTPVVLDVLLDHHLARHWDRYHEEPLAEFAQRRYAHCLPLEHAAVPSRLIQMLERMAQDNWLLHYRTEAGIRRALLGIARRIRFANPIEHEMDRALEVGRAMESELDQFLMEALEELGP
ncbi:MAG: acyl carrier protein phosphodiesterase [Saccharospirillum sp.]